MNRAQQQRMMTPRGKPRRQKSRKPKVMESSTNKNVINMPEIKGTDMENIIAHEEFKRNPPYLSLDKITGKKIVDDEGRLTPEMAQSIMGKKGGGKVGMRKGGLARRKRK